MSTGPQHYRKAEQLVDTVIDVSLPTEAKTRLLAIAQVHATLALAAATAMGTAAMHEYDCEAWDRVAGVQDDEHDDDPTPDEVMAELRAVFAGPVEGRDYHVMPEQQDTDPDNVMSGDPDETGLLTILEEGVHDGPVLVAVLRSIDGGPDFSDTVEAAGSSALVDRLLAWKNDAIERERALNAAYVDPFATEDIQQPCTRCGDLNHASRDCEAEDLYDGMTNADVMGYGELAEHDRDAEFALDAADEARNNHDDRDEDVTA